eukprot:TRINITY_DN1888_c0_g1_i2.p1 TRINITY_DN1888_c0_g1~~TRINITY_DN1888_c0_g1_i2.p1  ORF type:complete len:125 (-),score=2.42 TRINITY_DN1888_c0_g1_i2:314-688(-)
MIIHENLLYSTDYGSGKVKIYNLHDFELINSFPVLGPCFDMVISYPFIFSACWNKIIEVVDLRTYEKVQVLRGHQSIVNKLLIRNDILYSCSADKTIRVCRGCHHLLIHLMLQYINLITTRNGI